MSDLNRQARDLVDFVRARSGPTEADAARVETALFAKIAATPATPSLGSSAGTRLGLVKAAIATLAALAVVVGAVLATRAMDGLAPPAVDTKASATPAPSNERVSPTKIRPTADGDANGPPGVDVWTLPSARVDRPTHAAPPASEADAELGLLRRAHRELADNELAAALATVDEHRRRFPGSALSEERDALRIHVLCAGGRGNEGRSEAIRFVADHPHSPQIPALERSCTEKAMEGR